MAAVEGRGPRDGPNTSASTCLSATGSPNFSGSCAHNPLTIPSPTPVASASLPRYIAALVAVIVRHAGVADRTPNGDVNSTGTGSSHSGSWRPFSVTVHTSRVYDPIWTRRG